VRVREELSLPPAQIDARRRSLDKGGRRVTRTRASVLSRGVARTDERACRCSARLNGRRRLLTVSG
jgi:hypothetical protein